MKNDGQLPCSLFAATQQQHHDCEFYYCSENYEIHHSDNDISWRKHAVKNKFQRVLSRGRSGLFYLDMMESVTGLKKLRKQRFVDYPSLVWIQLSSNGFKVAIFVTSWHWQHKLISNWPSAHLKVSVWISLTLSFSFIKPLFLVTFHEGNNTRRCVLPSLVIT